MKKPHIVPATPEQHRDLSDDISELLQESDRKVREFFERLEADRPQTHASPPPGRPRPRT